jgi:hypothetical protein
MTLQIIGAGFGRTGTYSLKVALEMLGYDKCYHMSEVFEHPEDAAVWEASARGEQVDWDALFEDYAAGVDWPVAAFWRELMAHYPEAKIILTVRDANSWYESASKTIFANMTREVPPQAPLAVRQVVRMINELVAVKGFGGNLTNREHMIRIYHQHNEEVKRGVPAGRLLVFDTKEGWEPLCRFLGKPVPQVEYPRTNTSEEFIARRAADRPREDANGRNVPENT